MSAITVQTHADKPYAVLELPIDNEFESTVYAVPACTAWLEDIYKKTVSISAKEGKEATFAALCKWPPHESKLSDYLEKKKKPNENWITYENVKIFKFCKSIGQAKEEAEKALNISDLSQSDKEKNIKRKRFETRRYSPPLGRTSVNRGKSTNIYSNDSESDFELQTPIVKTLQINAKKKTKKTSLHSDSDETYNNNCTKQNVFAFKSQEPEISAANAINNAVRITYSSTDENISENIDPNLPKKRTCNVLKNVQSNKQVNVVREYNNSDERSFCTTKQHDRSVFPATSHNKSSVNINSGLKEKSIMAAISDLRSRIDKLQGTATQIYIATCHPAETLDNSIGIPTLPLTSMEDFRLWEDFIVDEEKKFILIQLFLEHCTEDLKGSIYGIMRKLMTNKLAIYFNLKGTNREGARIEKKKFQSTTSYGLIIATLRRHAQERIDKGLHFTYNREITDLHVANWLKDAKKRLQNEEHRLQKSRQRDDEEDYI